MSNLPARQNSQIQTHKEKVDDVRNQFKKMAAELAVVLPNGMRVDRLIRITMTCIQNKPQLLDCDRRSLMAAVVQCAQLGLEPDPIIGQAYLVPYKGKVQLQPGYKGLLDLARRSDMVLSVNAGVVHVGDDFDYAEGSGAFVRHRKNLDTEPGPFYCAWACAELRGSNVPSVKVLPKWFVEKIRAISPSGNTKDAPWQNHYDAQATKTAIKQLSKVIPASVELRRAVALDDKAEVGEEQNLDAVLESPLDVAPGPDSE